MASTATNPLTEPIMPRRQTLLSATTLMAALLLAVCEGQEVKPRENAVTTTLAGTSVHKALLIGNPIFC